jgi:hypothetical protein
MASVEDIKLHVAASVDQTERATETMRAAADQLDEALGRLRLTVVGSAHPVVADAIGRLEQARSRLDEAQALARAAIDAADAYRSLV